MKIIFLLFFTLLISVGLSQSIIEWDPNYKIQLSDFQSSQTEISDTLTSYSIFPGANIDFSYYMSNAEFMFTKNFNAKVKTTFNKNAAIILAPDSITAEQLVLFGQYSFDLTELYSRKLRRELYENKGAFSSADFFKPIFNTLMEEFNAESAKVLKLTDLGRNTALLAQEHNRVLSEIALMSDFCSSCKPPKKKNKSE